MQIKEVRVEEAAHMISGHNPISGSATVMDGGMEITFRLSLDTIQIIQECIERDYDAKKKELS